jgi:hypothetical protein
VFLNTSGFSLQLLEIILEVLDSLFPGVEMAAAVTGMAGMTATPSLVMGRFSVTVTATILLLSVIHSYLPINISILVLTYNI